MMKIDVQQCDGCGACVDECRLGGIEIDERGKAFIEQRLCLRCGWCSDTCPFEAIQFTDELIPLETASYLEDISKILRGCAQNSHQKTLLERIIKNLELQRQVLDETITHLQNAKETPLESLTADIKRLQEYSA